jgi:Zn-finger nucleic acid-binding protein
VTRDCPACTARPLVGVSAQPSGPKMLWRCAQCRGVWVSLGDVAQMRGSFGADHPLLDETRRKPHCRSCGRGFAADQTGCDEKHDQAIACVSCAQKMERIQLGEVVIDVCLLCRAAWFDEGELGVMVRRHARPVRQRAKSARQPALEMPQPNLASDVVDAGFDLLGLLDAVGSSRTVGGAVIDVAAIATLEGVFAVLGGVLEAFDGS